jgi:ATP-binding cassette subfamily B protein
LKYRLEDFLDHWISTKSGGEEKGIALLLEPTTLFYEKKDEKNSKSNKLHFLFRYFRDRNLNSVQKQFTLHYG